nr:c-type cytochrome [Sulfurimonas sp. SAG-AH-194-C20]
MDGGALFAKCSGCHGVNADKKALNKSQSIKGWSVAKLSDAINGYKDGSYGGSMKGVMKPQVSKLSDEEIKALSEYISKL